MAKKAKKIITSEDIRHEYWKRRNVDAEVKGWEEVGKLLTAIQQRNMRELTASNQNANDAGPKLTPMQVKILRALVKLNATSTDSRRSKSRLLPHVDKDSSSDSLKEPIAALKRIGYVASTGPGRDGGYWITSEGMERIKQQ